MCRNGPGGCRCLRSPFLSIDVSEKKVWSWSIKFMPINLNDRHKDIILESICSQAAIMSRMGAMM